VAERTGAAAEGAADGAGDVGGLGALVLAAEQPATQINPTAATTANKRIRELVAPPAQYLLMCDIIMFLLPVTKHHRSSRAACFCRMVIR
jgi:hypothetical protein